MNFGRVMRVIGLGVVAMCVTALEAKTVTLGAADNRTDVSLNLGDTVVVELSSGDVNGFGWVLHLAKDSGLAELGDDVSSAGRKSEERRRSPGSGSMRPRLGISPWCSALRRR